MLGRHRLTFTLIIGVQVALVPEVERGIVGGLETQIKTAIR